jgi:hypothetical protein
MMLVTRLATFLVVASCLSLGVLYAPANPVAPLAPPPKPASNPGRITVWAGEKLASFNPDGGDCKTTDAPLLDDPWPIRVYLAPDGKSMVYRREESTQAAALRMKIVDAPTAKGAGDQFVLSGYVASRYEMTPDGKQVFFSGTKGDEGTPDTEPTRAIWEFDRSNRKVTRVPGTDGQNLIAAAGSGKSFLSFRRVEVNGTPTGMQNYLVSAAGGPPVEVLGDKCYVDFAAFSGDGRYLLANVWDYDSVEFRKSGGSRFVGLKRPRVVLFDIEKRAESPVRVPYKEGRIAALGWSPDGAKVAVAWQDPAAAADFDPTAQEQRKRAADERAAAGLPRGETVPIGAVRISVSDPDGSNAREVYKSPKGRLLAFEWR